MPSITGTTNSARSSSTPSKMKVRARSILACLTLVATTGCSASSQDEYSDVQARLDPLAGEIILPLEAFAMSTLEEKDVAHANALLQDECLAKSGREFPRADLNWELAPILPDRRYGLWSEADAQTNGYEFPESEDAAAITTIEDGLGDDWWDAFEACRSELQLLPLLGVNTSPNPSPVDEGMGESFDFLRASDDLGRLKGEWQSCIEAEGLTALESSSLLIPMIPPPGEEQIRVATIDVECKQSLNSVQQLADIEAREQSAFIDERENDLVEYRAEVDKVLERAREVLATRGA